MRLLRFASLALLSAPLLLAAACSSTLASSADDTEAPDSGTDATAHGDATVNDGGNIADAGGILYSDDMTVKVTSMGGFGPEAIDGSTCIPADTTFTYVLATKALTWKICALEDGGTFAYDSGSRTLTATEATTLQASLDAVAINRIAGGCGADKPMLMMELASPSALTPSDYYDQFYHCSDDGKTYVDGLDAVIGTATTIAH